jgi:hypothetical protein
MTSAMVIGACSPVTSQQNMERPDATREVIEWSSGGSFAGARGGKLYADDSSTNWAMPPFGQIKEARSQLKPGTFQKALAWLRSQRLRRADRETGLPCADYGTDLVRYTGPGQGIDFSAGCPNNRILPLQHDLLKVISEAQRDG